MGVKDINSFIIFSFIGSYVLYCVLSEVINSSGMMLLLTAVHSE